MHRCWESSSYLRRDGFFDDRDPRSPAGESITDTNMTAADSDGLTVVLSVHPTGYYDVRLYLSVEPPSRRPRNGECQCRHASLVALAIGRSTCRTSLIRSITRARSSWRRRHGVERTAEVARHGRRPDRDQIANGTSENHVGASHGGG